MKDKFIMDDEFAEMFLEREEWDIHKTEAGHLTCGMEQYNHPNFLLVNKMPTPLAGYVLNTICDQVKAGMKFGDGYLLRGLFNGFNIFLSVQEGSNGRVLNAIMCNNS